MKLEGVFKTPHKLMIVMEYLETDLHEALELRAKVGRLLSPPDAGTIIYRLADALKYLHAQGVVHRDLKPENILVSGRDPTDVKLADFGTAGRMGPGRDKLLTHCGPPSYVAPEVLNNPPEKWDRIDPDGTGPIDLIKRCLVVDPALRITAPKILQHPWVSRHFKPLKRSAPTPHMPASPWLYSSSPPRRPVHSALGMMERLPDILLDSSSTDVTTQSQLWKELQRQKIQPPQIQPLPSPPSRHRRSSFSYSASNSRLTEDGMDSHSSSRSSSRSMNPTLDGGNHGLWETGGGGSSYWQGV
eukprot:g42213.t1